MYESHVASLRERVEQCRKLAATTDDELTAKVLRQIADEVEEDIRKLILEGRSSLLPDPPW